MSDNATGKSLSLKVLELSLERDNFMLSLLRELSGTLQDVVGLEESEGFVSVVGQRVGENINEQYREALGERRLTREQVAEVLVDLKRRIGGDFYVIEASPQRIVLGNRRCPFGEHVRERPSLCMMTSNVFGVIVSENLGFAQVELQETIAEGHAECRVVVNLEPGELQDERRTRTYVGSTGNGEA